MSTAAEVGKRVGLTVAVAAIVVVAAVAVGIVATPSGDVPPGADHPEYAADELVPDRLESSGAPNPSGDVGTVVIDQTRGNRFDREDVTPLVEAITSAGGEVRYSAPTADMGAVLSDADVLVVVDPADEYSREAVQAIQQFLDRGGRLVIFGEPNRRETQQNQIGVVLTTQRSHLTTLSSTFGISFGTQYLYDMEHNDGNFKNVLVGPPDDVSRPLVEGVDDVALDTATSVSIDGGTVLLRTASTAEQGTNSQQAGFPVAVVNGNGTVLAVGDRGFLHPEFASVGDNDVFIERIVEFMAGANAQQANASVGNSRSEGALADSTSSATLVDSTPATGFAGLSPGGGPADLAPPIDALLGRSADADRPATADSLTRP